MIFNTQVLTRMDSSYSGSCTLWNSSSLENTLALSKALKDRYHYAPRNYILRSVLPTLMSGLKELKGLCPNRKQMIWLWMGGRTFTCTPVSVACSLMVGVWLDGGVWMRMKMQVTLLRHSTGKPSPIFVFSWYLVRAKVHWSGRHLNNLSGFS